MSTANPIYQEGGVRAQVVPCESGGCLIPADMGDGQYAIGDTNDPTHMVVTDLESIQNFANARPSYLAGVVLGEDHILFDKRNTRRAVSTDGPSVESFKQYVLTGGLGELATGPVEFAY